MGRGWGSRVYMVLTLGWMDCVHDTTWTGIAHWRSVRGRACVRVSEGGNEKRQRLLPLDRSRNPSIELALDDENPSNST